MPDKKLIAQFRKSGDIDSIILAYELDSKRQFFNAYKTYNNFTMVQRAAAVEFLQKGINLGLDDKQKTDFLYYAGKGENYQSSSESRYYTYI